MEGLNIIVTGASQGIGYEIARQFAMQGDNNKIFAISRNSDRLNELRVECEHGNSKSHLYPITFDLNTTEPYNNKLIPLLKEASGRIDILINNAGSLYNKEFEKLTDEEMAEMVSVNFLSVAKLCKAVIPMMSMYGGHVVNISSMGGFQGSIKFKGLSVYSASKAAVASLTECLAEEYKDSKIAFNCLALGAVDTAMFRAAFPSLSTPMTAEKIASFIVKFSIEGSNYFRGKILPVTQTTP